MFSNATSACFVMSARNVSDTGRNALSWCGGESSAVAAAAAAARGGVSFGGRFGGNDDVDDTNFMDHIDGILEMAEHVVVCGPSSSHGDNVDSNELSLSYNDGFGFDCHNSSKFDEFGQQANEDFPDRGGGDDAAASISTTTSKASQHPLFMSTVLGRQQQQQQQQHRRTPVVTSKGTMFGEDDDINSINVRKIEELDRMLDGIMEAYDERQQQQKEQLQRQMLENTTQMVGTNTTLLQQLEKTSSTQSPRTNVSSRCDGIAMETTMATTTSYNSNSNIAFFNDGKFQNYQHEAWDEKLDELKQFKAAFGHCQVPHKWSVNPQLAHWVKRQRYQYKLHMEGRHSTMRTDRIRVLNSLGFIWDSHQASWEDKFQQLITYKRQHGHMRVSSKGKYHDHGLSVWVKSQRRARKLFDQGDKRSTMTKGRIDRLDSIGFNWNPRKL